METLVWIVHVLVSIGIVALVLMQHGKGADMGAAFGSGASGSLFGATGAANALSRTTKVLVTIFFLTSIGLTYFSVTRHAPPQPVAVERGAGSPPAEAPAAQAPASKAKDIPN